MKTLLLVLCLVGTLPWMGTGCQTTPSERVVQVQTLLAVGQSAEGTVGLSAQLYRDGKITAVQARSVLDFYNNKFQPAYRLAVATAQSNLATLASPDMMNLASQLSALVMQLYPPKP